MNKKSVTNQMHTRLSHSITIRPKVNFPLMINLILYSQRIEAWWSFLRKWVDYARYYTLVLMSGKFHNREQRTYILSKCVDNFTNLKEFLNSHRNSEITASSARTIHFTHNLLITVQPIYNSPVLSGHPRFFAHNVKRCICYLY